MFNINSLPNLLGLLRLLATPLLVWSILLGTPAGYLGAVLLLLGMAVSDFADGKIARHLNAVSRLGIFLDTTSDKIFVAGVLLPMVQQGLLSSWVAFVIIVREFIISGLRSYAAAEGTVISAGVLGKQKLAITVVALIWRLLAANAEIGGIFARIGAGVLLPILNLWPLAIWVAVIWTIGSAVDYLRKSWPLLRESWTPLPAGVPRAETEVESSAPRPPE